MDLNIVGKSLLTDETMSEMELLRTIRTAFKLGYEVVAVNTVIGPEQLEGKGSKIPDPIIVGLGADNVPEVKLSGKTFKVLSRLTAVVNDNNHCAKLMKSPVVNKYDIIAVDPQNLKVFQHICGSIEVDLISFDMTCKPKFHWKLNNVKQATRRGICFELQYSPCLRGQDTCRFTIANSNYLSELLNGKNIIVSSGAKKMIELRGPFDVSSLAHGVFGIKEDLAKATVRSNCKKVILRSDIRRKTGKGIVSVQDVTALAEDDKWLREACTFLVEVKGESEDDEEEEERTEEGSGSTPKHKRIKLESSIETTK